MTHLCRFRLQRALISSSVAAAASLTPSLAQAQEPPLARRPTTSGVAFLDGVWIGPAWMTLPNGQTVRFEQMERVGPMMGGEIRVMEGKGRDPSGKAVFNAFTVFSQSPDQGIEMRSYTMGYQNSRKLTLRDGKGFVWEIQAGPNKIRYTADVANGSWTEIGERIGADGKSTQFFEMKLKRVSDTQWPAENAAFPTR